MWQNNPYPASYADGSGKICEKHYGKQAGTQIISLETAGQVRNCTFWKGTDLLAESKKLPDLDRKADGTPVVLIYHTHTTESFMLKDNTSFSKSFRFRTTEPDKNMVSVGDAIGDSATVYAPIATINGKKSAQIMIISGCDDGTMNLRITAKISTSQASYSKPANPSTVDSPDLSYSTTENIIKI